MTTTTRETPYGTVEDLHWGPELRAWRIHKDDEEIEPVAQICSRDDLICVLEGTLRLELEGYEPADLGPGDVLVIPAHTRYRGYRWPRDGAPCAFVAVTTADAEFSTEG